MDRSVWLSRLDHARTLSVCSIRWERMTPVGDGVRVRHCPRCGVNVYDFSHITRPEAEALLDANEPGRAARATRRDRLCA